MEIKMPMARVKANPRMMLEPNQNKMAQVMREEMLESRIELQARWKPSSMALPRSRPAFNSSFRRSKIKTLASTAMPIDRMNPAMPAKVKVMENILKTSGILSKTRFKSLFDNTRAFSGLSSEIRKKFLEQCNYALYVSAKNELGLSDSIIDKIAADKTSANPNISLENFNIFKDPHVTKSHGRLINLGDLRSNPLCQEKIINRASELFADRATYETVDPLIWEFYVRKRQMLNDAGNKIVKTIETCDEDFINFGQK